MLTEGRSRDFWHLPEYAELLAIQQEAYSGYASGQFTDAKAVLNSIASKQQAILLEKGRTTVAIPDDIKDAQLPSRTKYTSTSFLAESASLFLFTKTAVVDIRWDTSLWVLGRSAHLKQHWLGV